MSVPIQPNTPSGGGSGNGSGSGSNSGLVEDGIIDFEDLVNKNNKT